MRKTVALMLVVCVAGTARADEPEKARAIIDRAIRGHGGADRLAKTRILIRTGKGTLALAGKDVPFLGEAILQFPDRARWSFDLDPDNQRVRMVVAINGEKGWRSGFGAVKEMEKLEREDRLNDVYVTWLTTLLPLREKGFELAPLAETKIKNQPAVGVRVTRKGRPEVKLYFDQETHLLVKMERKGKEAGLETTKEYFFGDFKDFEGVKVPTRILELTNGRKSAETVFTSYRFPDRIEENAFTRP